MKRVKLLSHPGYSILAGGQYCILLLIFIISDRFESIWLLYLGNVLFGIAIALFMLHHSKNRTESASTTGMIAAGTQVTIAGVILSAAIALLMLLIFAPQHFGNSGANARGQYLVQDLNQSNGNLSLTVFMNLIIGNIAAGSFAAVIFAYAAKPDQTSDQPAEILKE